MAGIREPSSEKDIAWGNVNRPIDPAPFDRLFAKTTAYFQSRPLFLADSVTEDPSLNWPAEMLHYGAVLLRDDSIEELFDSLPARIPALDANLPF